MLFIFYAWNSKLKLGSRKSFNL